MAKASFPRSGSLQFWPRKRARKEIPSVNWEAVYHSHSHPSLQTPPEHLLGFLCYKAGMKSAFVKDSTPHSLSKDKKIIVPATILEAPPMKILAVRFYKKNIVATSVMNQADKELKRVLKLTKKTASLDAVNVSDYDDVRVLVYSLARLTSVKKTPDIAEIALGGDIQKKFAFVKEFWNKEIHISDVFKPNMLADVRGITSGRGLSGPVKRYGIGLKTHKTEKGVRRPGSLGPWHPARVTFRTSQAGQLGMFSRVIYNQKILLIGKTHEYDINPPGGFPHYGKIKNDYLIIRGSVQGPDKRQLLVTYPLRPTKKAMKKNFEFLGLR